MNCLFKIAQILPRRHERLTYTGDTELSPRILQVHSTSPSIVEAGQPWPPQQKRFTAVAHLA